MGQSENSVALKEAKKPSCSRALERTDLGSNYHSSSQFQTNKAFDDNWAMERFFKVKDLCKGTECPNFTTIGGMSNKITPLISWLRYHAYGFSIKLLLLDDSFLSIH